MPHVMVDIETLGTRPGVVIAQIGWARFNENFVIDSGSIHPSIHHQLLLGLKAEPDTVKWWQEQDKEVHRRVFDHTQVIGLDEALEQFALLVTEEALGDEGMLWGDPDWFDLPILRAVYNAAKVEYPWPRRRTADARTLRQAAKMTSEQRTRSAKMHDGQYDAVAQAWDVIMCLQRLGAGDERRVE